MYYGRPANDIPCSVMVVLIICWYSSASDECVAQNLKPADSIHIKLLDLRSYGSSRRRSDMQAGANTHVGKHDFERIVWKQLYICFEGRSVVRQKQAGSHADGAAICILGHLQQARTFQLVLRWFCVHTARYNFVSTTAVELKVNKMMIQG